MLHWRQCSPTELTIHASSNEHYQNTVELNKMPLNNCHVHTRCGIF